MKLAWCTDTHFDIYGQDENIPYKYGASLRGMKHDGIIITGDISQSHLLKQHLSELVRGFGSENVYYVLGNHDVWGSHSKYFRESLTSEGYPGHYLTGCDPIRVSDGTYITGFDGWYDAQYGDFTQTKFFMNDWYRVSEICEEYIAGNGRIEPVIKVCRRIAESLSNTLPPKIASIANRAKRVIIATHIPPFPQNSNHRGAPSDAGSLPWYASKSSGDMLLSLFRKYPHINFEVLCGHSHSHAVYSPYKNATVTTGFAEYRRATVAGTIEALNDLRKM